MTRFDKFIDWWFTGRCLKHPIVGCAECGIGGGHALYCVACAEKFVGGYKDSGVPAVQTGLEQVSPDTPKDEALKLALEALEKSWNPALPSAKRESAAKEAITAIKEALAQPEPPILREW